MKIILFFIFMQIILAEKQESSEKIIINKQEDDLNQQPAGYDDVLKKAQEGYKNFLEQAQKIASQQQKKKDGYKKMSRKERDQLMTKEFQLNLQDYANEAWVNKNQLQSQNYQTHSLLTAFQIKQLDEIKSTPQTIYNFQLKGKKEETMLQIVENIPDDIYVFIIVMNAEQDVSQLVVTVQDPEDNLINEQQNTANFLIKFNATIPGQYSIKVKNEGYNDNHLMVISQQQNDHKANNNTQQMQLELLNNLQNNTYALSSNTSMHISQYYMQEALDKIYQVNAMDTYTNEKIEMRISKVENADYKIMIFTIIETIAIIICTGFQIQLIKKLLCGQTLL